MKISEVKTAFKIADVVYTPGTTKLDFRYLSTIRDENGRELPTKILSDNLSRVYLIVVDGEIKKIGGSQDKGGIKGTLNIYRDGGVKGRPSIRSFGIWYFIYYTILKGHEIEFYMIYQDNFPANVKGLFGYHKIDNAFISYKLIEECCLADYRNKENGNYPDWNIQEKGMDWPDDIKDEHAQITQKAQNRKKNITRAAVQKP